MPHCRRSPRRDCSIVARIVPLSVWRYRRMSQTGAAAAASGRELSSDMPSPANPRAPQDLTARLFDGGSSLSCGADSRVRTLC
jgi:hypothetical protein